MSANQKVNLLPGDYLFREGEFGQTAYLIDEGTIELVKFTGDQQTVLAELEKGALFGEMAIIENSARSASARAKTNCTLSIVTEEKLKRHLSSSPNVALDMMRKLAGYARSANEKLTRDAFATDALEKQDEISSEVRKKDGKSLDFQTKRTLREFNDDIDEFSDISPKRSLTISGILIICLVLAFGIWASIAKIDVTVSSRGMIMTSIPNVDVQSNYSSVVKQLLIKEGDSIKKGQPIVTFDETLTAADYRDTEEQLIAVEKDLDRTEKELAFIQDKGFSLPTDPLQKAIFEDQVKEVALQKQEFETTLEQLKIEADDVQFENDKLNQQYIIKRQLMSFLLGEKVEKSSNEKIKRIVDSKIQDLDLSLYDLDAKIKQLKKEVSRTKGLLNKKLIPLEQYESLVFELEQLETQKNKFLSSQLATLYQEISDLEDNLQKTKIQKTEIAVKIKQEEISNEKFISKVLKEKNSKLQELSRKRSALSEKFIKLTRQIQDVELLSPVSGTVLELEDRFVGSVINTGDVIATVVPEDVNFHVEVDIDPADITHVFEGAEVKILLDSLPSQKHGELKGLVRMISGDAVSEDVFGEKKSVYRAEVDIIENNLTSIPEGFKLLPSMNVTGNIKSGTRTVMTFLIFPVIKTLQTSFREP
ncbi:MAG: cyclic nucleotide-binding domain-containing protein [Candidatus Puniceispirillaceae bacterium]